MSAKVVSLEEIRKADQFDKLMAHAVIAGDDIDLFSVEAHIPVIIQAEIIASRAQGLVAITTGLPDDVEHRKILLRLLKDAARQIEDSIVPEPANELLLP